MHIDAQMNVTYCPFSEGADPPMGARLHRVGELTKEAAQERIR